MACVPPVRVVTCWTPERFCTTPPATSTSAPAKAIGSRMRSVPRTRSTQKLPIVADSRRAKPRTRATATAMPAAAETKFCTASAAICVRCPMVDSPAYACQLVLVTKLIAVFQAMWPVTGSMPRLSGSRSCRRCMPYTTRTETSENASSARA
ncbi:hypothetical protein GCM10020001_099080 [Nonomuraea salmonea]